jgi:hypothetical protein
LASRTSGPVHRRETSGQLLASDASPTVAASGERQEHAAKEER